MRITDYLKDKGIFLTLNLMIFIVISIFMYIADISFMMILFIFCIWFLPLFTYIFIEYIKYKKYFNDMESILESLDKKYLLPEVMEEANFLIAEQINDILKEVSRDMHEHVKYYEDMQKEYREYIEMWIHEIKTPIASSKLVIENNYNNDIVRKIDTQINKIDNFVEQVLYYSRSNEVGKDYIIKKVELEPLVKKVIKRNQRDFISKRISLELEDLEQVVYSDSKWIEFILNQIIVNAIKYSKGNNDKIEIESKKQNNSVILSIKDYGVGINEKDIGRVFEKGFTGDNGRKFGKSTGIGLYLCKKLCEKLGLGLYIDSKENLVFSLQRIWQEEDSSELDNKEKEMLLYLRNKGLTKPTEYKGIFQCYADKENCIVINYNGDIYKCTANDFLPEKKEGILNSNGVITYNSLYEKRMKAKYALKPCLECNILPICMICTQKRLKMINEEKCIYIKEKDKPDIIRDHIRRIYKETDIT